MSYSPTGTTAGTVASGSDSRLPATTVINVAAPTGVAATDRANIAAAITALTSSGGCVQLQTGTYLVDTTINIPITNKMTIQGYGWGTSVKLAAAANTYVFTMQATDTRVTLRDMTIDGNLSAQTGVSGGVFGAGAVACRFDNIHFTACRDDALLLSGQTGGAFGHNNRIIGCLFDQSVASTGPGRGIHMTSNDENQIIGCDFEFLGGSGGSGATAASMIYDEAGTQFIIGCNFVNGANNAIGVRVQNAKSTKIVGCNFDGTSGHSIFIAGQKCVVSNNTIFSPGIAGTAGAANGIYLEFANAFNMVTGNTISSDTTNGVSRTAIREASDGGGGANNIVNNRVITQGTWSFAALDLSGAGSLIQGNQGGGVAGDHPAVIEGANGKQGVATLVGGSSVVSNNSVTATSRIMLTSQSDGGTPGFLRVSTRTPGTSFTITSSSGTDTSVVAWKITEAL